PGHKGSNNGWRRKNRLFATETEAGSPEPESSDLGAAKPCSARLVITAAYIARVACTDDEPPGVASQCNWRRWSTGQDGKGVPKPLADSTETRPSFGPSTSDKKSKNGL